jgi:hypothetical protein
MCRRTIPKQAIGLLPVRSDLRENLFGATPADAVKFNYARICCRMTRATSVAVGSPAG